MSEKSKTTIMLREQAAKGNAKAKAILAIYAVAESMRSTGGNSQRKRMQDAAQVLRENGNEALAVEYEKKAAALPESSRGVSLADAMAKVKPHLATIDKDDSDVYKNGLTALGTKVAYGIGIEVGTFEKGEKPKKSDAPAPAVNPAQKK